MARNGTIANRTRLADLAEKANVSLATVSRVLNGKPGVAAETRQAVFMAMDELGYEKPASATVRTAGLVGLIVPDLSNPIFTVYAQFLENQLAAQSLMAVLCTSELGITSEIEYLEVLAERKVTGIIAVSGLTANTVAPIEPYQRILAQNIPLVAINGYSPQLKLSYFNCDDDAAITKSVTHLHSLGHTRIGMAIGPQRYIPSQRKVRAFLAAQTAAGCDASDSVLETQYTVEAGEAAARELVERGHTAIVCGSDLMALGAIRGVRGMGLSVPQDVSVIGYDDTPLIAYTSPALTTIRQPVRQIATAAVNALTEQIAGQAGHRTQMLFQPELIVRDSTGPVPSA